MDSAIWIICRPDIKHLQKLLFSFERHVATGTYLYKGKEAKQMQANYSISNEFTGKTSCGSGSVCFWASRLRTRQSEVRIRILQTSSKIVRKTMIPTVL
jgi:hypothetical protein